MVYYNFHCKNCGQFEINIPMRKATEVTNCPICNRLSKRIWDTVGIQWNCDGNFGASNNNNNE